MRYEFGLFYLDFVYPAGKPMIPHLLCYQGFAVNDYDFTLDAADLGHPRLSLNWAFKIINNVGIQADSNTHFVGIAWNHRAMFAITEIIFISHGLHLSRLPPEER